MNNIIPFNKPYLTGNETEYISDAVYNEMKISGNGKYTKLCHDFFEKRYKFKKSLLTTSCTDALEMSAILIDVKDGDEVIMPSYTFVSTANAFVLRGAKIVFVDSREEHPGMDEDKLEELISPKTKAIVVVHYAGIACDMDKIMDVANKYNLFVIEDAAQAIDSFYIDKNNEKKPLGGIGHLGCFSFHETKNIQCGEGGMLVINDDRFINRAEIIWEKGTNRAAFWRGDVDKYGWVDVGSSFLPSEITAAFLWAQLEKLKEIQSKRIDAWRKYYKLLKPMEDVGAIKLQVIPNYATNNAHMFYIKCKSEEERSSLILHFKRHDIISVFHYLSLHNSKFYNNKHDGRVLNNSDMYSDCLVRLPLYYNLKENEIEYICDRIINFYN